MERRSKGRNEKIFGPKTILMSTRIWIWVSSIMPIRWPRKLGGPNWVYFYVFTSMCCEELVLENIDDWYLSFVLKTLKRKSVKINLYTCLVKSLSVPVLTNLCWSMLPQLDFTILVIDPSSWLVSLFFFSEKNSIYIASSRFAYLSVLHDHFER